MNHCINCNGYIDGYERKIPHCCHATCIGEGVPLNFIDILKLSAYFMRKKECRTEKDWLNNYITMNSVKIMSFRYAWCGMTEGSMLASKDYCNQFINSCQIHDEIIDGPIGKTLKEHNLSTRVEPYVCRGFPFYGYFGGALNLTQKRDWQCNMKGHEIQEKELFENEIVFTILLDSPFNTLLKKFHPVNAYHSTGTDMDKALSNINEEEFAKTLNTLLNELSKPKNDELRQAIKSIYLNNQFTSL